MQVRGNAHLNHSLRLRELAKEQVWASAKSTDSYVNRQVTWRSTARSAEGTSVKIYLPRYHGEEDLAEVFNKAASDSRSPGAETILVVEDDETLRLYTVEILTDLGYSVLAAANAAAALEIIGRGHDIDLLFTDIIMPGGMNGRQLADQAIRRRPALRVLFTTGYTANAIVHHGRLDPDVELISKPFTYDSLAHKIRTLLDAKRS
jgi:CheY-like chemotaxis protein